MMSVPAQGPITLYPPKRNLPIEVPAKIIGKRRFNFLPKLKIILTFLAFAGLISGIYSFADDVRAVIAQGGSAVTLDLVLDENFNLSLAGYLEGSQLRSTVTSGDPLVVNSTGLVDDLNADLLDGQHGSYYLDLSSLDGVSNNGGNIDLIAGADVTITPSDVANTITISSSSASSGWVDDGAVVRLSTASDKVGIGISSPGSTLHVFKSDNAGSQSSLKAGSFELYLNANDDDPFNSWYSAVQGRSRYYGSDTGGSPDIGHVRGVLGTAYNYGTGTLYASAGVQGSSFVYSSGDITEASGVFSSAGTYGSGSIERAIAFYTPGIQNTSTGIITKAYGLLIGGADGEGTINTNYGIFIENQNCAGCGDVWALYAESGDSYLNGNLTIGEQLKTTANATNNLNMFNNGVSLESYFSIQMNLDNDNNDSDEEFKVVTDGGATSLFVINGDGDVGIGADIPSQRLEVATAFEGDVMRLNDGTETCDLDPDATQVTETCSSDIRLKTNISDASSVLNYLTNLPLKEFDMISSGEHYLGVIAQDLLALPEYADLVVQGEDGYYRVKSISPWEIIKGIQELSQKVQSLQLAIDSSGEAAQANTDGSITEIVSQTVKADEGWFDKLTIAVEAIFEKITVKVAEIASAVIENLKVKFLTIGESSAPTGLTIYDRATGEPYCVSVLNGEITTEAGICE